MKVLMFLAPLLSLWLLSLWWTTRITLTTTTELVHFGAPTTSCRTTGPTTAFADRAELDGAVNQFITDGN
jgi:hypothetical protein